MQSRIIAAIVEELSKAFVILNRGKENFHRMPQHLSLSERYRYEYRDKQFDEQTLEPMEKALQRMSSVKLENEVELLRLVLLDLIHDLNSTNSYRHLQAKINEFLRDASAEYNFIGDYVFNNKRLTELKFELNIDKDNGEKILKDLNDEIMNVESRVHNNEIQNELKFSLVAKWEKTRHQQANIILSKEETRLLAMCDDYKVKIDREQIAINDIQSKVNRQIHNQTLIFKAFLADFLHFQIDDLATQINNWMERYVKEAEELDIDIGQLKDAIQDIKSKKEDITEKYDMRQIEINEYREEQRILEEKRLFEEKQCNSAIRIQVSTKRFHLLTKKEKGILFAVVVARRHGQDGAGAIPTEKEE
ncbi:hypothetical protein Bhyg_13263 [Pseudolycoriella hygida]|uniref:Uncharacterized protein n=1 Tax=Pseudolycoriella hygida TaxID=35572 RepID=A0A9Q0MN09_9DIPT|nr:hypothetical protein Bhyg_13263 [Pseudolycoriella hygida]